MRYLALICVGILSAPAARIHAQPAPAMVGTAAPTKAEAALLAAEDRRFKAELTHNAVALDRMTADDVVYSHFNGARENKAAVLRTFTHLPFSSITPSDRYARVIGDIGIVRGKVVRQLPDGTLPDGYLAVYVNRDGRWQLLEWVSAAPPLDNSSDRRRE